MNMDQVDADLRARKPTTTNDTKSSNKGSITANTGNGGSIEALDRPDYRPDWNVVGLIE